VPSPLAHVGAALALLVGLSPRGAWPAPTAVLPYRLGFAAALAAVAPDFDILAAVLLPSGLDWHRGPSHSLLGAAAIGAFVAWVCRVEGRSARAVVVGAAVLHVPFDWSTGEPGAPARYGVPWAWPFSSDKSIDPTPWFGAFRIDEQGFLANMWAPHALPVYLGELGTVCALVAAAAAARHVYFRVTSTNS
jgi:membrane-bound metal-dependent hydrolase YbcI (DUF457 family)